MRRISTGFVTCVCFLCAFALHAQSVPGEVVTSVGLSIKGPTGLAWDGSHLWVADLVSATISEVDPSSGKVTKSMDAPGYAPMGLAWDGKWLWVLDAADKTAYALDVSTGVTERALTLDLDSPEGLAWDGKALWVADAAISLFRTRLLRRCSPRGDTRIRLTASRKVE